MRITIVDLMITVMLVLIENSFYIDRDCKEIYDMYLFMIILLIEMNTLLFPSDDEGNLNFEIVSINCHDYVLMMII